MAGWCIRLTLIGGIFGLWSCASPPPAPDTSAATWLQEQHALAVDLTQAEHERMRQVAILLQQPLDLEGVLTLFLINAPQVRTELAALGIAQAHRLQAGLVRNPVLAVGALRPEGGGRWQLDAGLSQSLLDLFTRPLRTRLADAELAQAKLSLYHHLNSQLHQVQAQYWQAVAAQQLLSLQQTQLQAAEASVSLAQSLWQAGNIPEATLLQFQLDLQARKRALLVTVTDAQRVELVLAGLLGLPSSTSLILPRRLPQLPPVEELTVAGLYQSALSERIDLQLAQAQRDLATHNLALQQRTGALTEVDLGVEVERETDGGYLAGPEISVGVPLFDRGAARKLLAKTSLARTEAQVRALEHQIETDIASAFIALQAARRTLEQFEDHDLPMQRKLQALTLREYNFMLTSPFELLRLKQQELALQQESVKALLTYWQARSDLAFASGMPEIVTTVKASTDSGSLEPPAAESGHHAHDPQPQGPPLAPAHDAHSSHHHGDHHHD